MSTVADAELRLRVRIDETTARKWSSAQLVYYISDAQQYWTDRLGKIKGSGRFRYRDTWTQSASTETKALSALTKTFAEVIEIAMTVGNLWVPLQILRDGDDSLCRNVGLGNGNVVPAYTIRGEEIVLLPTSTATRAMAIVYRWKSAPTTSTATTLDLPDEFLTDLVSRAAHFALADAGLKNAPFEEEYAARIAEIEDGERRIWGSQSEVIRPKRSRGLFATR